MREKIMSNVKEYRKWLKAKLKEAKKFPDDAEVIIMNDEGAILEDGGAMVLEPEEIMTVDFDGTDVTIAVVTDY